VILTTPLIGGLFVYRVLSGRAKKRAKAGRERPPLRPGRGPRSIPRSSYRTLSRDLGGG
jgi:hypothetical protein